MAVVWPILSIPEPAEAARPWTPAVLNQHLWGPVTRRGGHGAWLICTRTLLHYHGRGLANLIDP
jgi:hypothetical protein